MTAAAQTPGMTTIDRPTYPNRDMIDAYVQHMRETGKAESSIGTYRHALNRADRELPSGLLADDAELAAWIADQPTPSTRATYRAALRGIYGWGVEAQWIDCNPAAALPNVKVRRRLPRPVPPAQLAAILAGIDGPARLWTLLALRAGLRCIEIARLRAQDVTDEAIYVMGKGSYERLVPTHPDLWPEFAGRQPGRVADYGGVEETRKYISRRAGIEFARLGTWAPRVTAHRLRHTFASQLIDADVPTRVVQTLMGHSRVATTEIYTQVTTRATRAAVLRLPTLPG